MDEEVRNTKGLTRSLKKAILGYENRDALMGFCRTL